MGIRFAVWWRDNAKDNLASVWFCYGKFSIIDTTVAVPADRGEPKPCHVMTECSFQKPPKFRNRFLDLLRPEHPDDEEEENVVKIFEDLKKQPVFW